MNKEIKAMGGSAFIIIDKTMSILSNIKVGDNVEVKCSKNKIILIKKTGIE